MPSPETFFTSENEVSSNDDFAFGLVNRLSLIHYKDGSKKIFKTPLRPEDSNDLIGIKAIAAYRIDQLLGLDLVPETNTAFHCYGKNSPVAGTVQLFVEGACLYQDKLRDVSQEEINHFLQRILLTRSTIDEIERERFFQNELSRMVADKAIGKESALPLNWEIKVKPPFAKMNRHNTHSRVMERGQFIDEIRAARLFSEGKLSLETREAFAICEINFSHPKIQETMANAQLFDLLVGEMDRHGHNFIYEKKEENHFVPRLIDHECAFSITFDDIARPSTAIVGVPRLIDHKTASKILRLTPKKLQETLVEAGLEKREEEVCLQRLHQLKKHISAMGEKYGFVKEWNDKTFQEQLGFKDNYLQREHERRFSKISTSRWRAKLVLNNILDSVAVFQTMTADELIRLFTSDYVHDGALWKTLQREHSDLLAIASKKIEHFLKKMSVQELVLLFLEDHEKKIGCREMLSAYQADLLTHVSKKIEELFLQMKPEVLLAGFIADHSNNSKLWKMLKAYHFNLVTMLSKKIEKHFLQKSEAERVTLFVIDHVSGKKLLKLLQSHFPDLLEELIGKMKLFLLNMPVDQAMQCFHDDLVYGSPLFKILLSEHSELLMTMLRKFPKSSQDAILSSLKITTAQEADRLSKIFITLGSSSSASLQEKEQSSSMAIQEILKKVQADPGLMKAALQQILEHFK